MRKALLVLLFISFLFPLNSCKRRGDGLGVSRPKKEVNKKDNHDYEIFVIGVSDGDTFSGLTHTEKIEIRYRIYGIDAPEKSQPFANKSKEYLADLIFNKKVKIKVETKRDRYGRPIVRVFTSDGKDVGAELLKNGLAWHYKEYDDSEEYALFEEEARNKKTGLWSDKSSVAPWEYRKR